jgi:hypothetical protein
MTASARPDHTSGIESSAVPHAEVEVFLSGWDGVAATLIDRHLNISASTALAKALFPNLLPGVNLVRQVFLGSAPGEEPRCARELAPQVIAALQALLASHKEDAAFRQLVGELSAMSRSFSTAWADGTAAFRTSGVFGTDHPSLGLLSIRYQLLELTTGRGEILIVWRGADPLAESAVGGLIPPATNV